jgi:hypothetical protein
MNNIRELEIACEKAGIQAFLIEEKAHDMIKESQDIYKAAYDALRDAKIELINNALGFTKYQATK